MEDDGSLSENGKMFTPQSVRDARETYLFLIESCSEEEKERYRRMFRKAYGEDL